MTGAGGRLGSYLREPLAGIADELVSTDITEDIGKLYSGEQYIKADLANYDEVDKVLKGADMVVHMGAIADEAPFEELLGPNFVALTISGNPHFRMVSAGLCMPAPFTQ